MTALDRIAARLESGELLAAKSCSDAVFLAPLLGVCPWGQDHPSESDELVDDICVGCGYDAITGAFTDTSEREAEA